MTFTLDKRSRSLLKTLIEKYIAHGQPVGSRTLSHESELELSPATIRNVMSDLENMGLITSPHTSAGRIPTALGYRLFVDTMLTTMDKSAPSNDNFEKKLPQSSELASETPQKIIVHAAQILSDLSQFVGVVLAPKRPFIFNHIEFLRLSDKRLLLIIVEPNGDVQNLVLLTDTDYSPQELTNASQFLNQHYSGLDFEQVKNRIKTEMHLLQKQVADLMQTAINASSDAVSKAQEAVVISGKSNLLSISDFYQDMEQLRRAFDLFEQKTQLIRLLESSNQAQGVRIFIGGENKNISENAIEDLSIVSSNYAINGQVVGTLGVIGPTRMPYKKVINIVDITAKMVGSALSGGG